MVSLLAALPLFGAAAADDPRVTPVVQAVQEVMPAVVNIGTERIVRVADLYAEEFNSFFGPHFRYTRKSIPLGSGIIVDESGLVLTNYHVVQRASEVQVKLWDGRLLQADMVACDPANDLSLLHLEGNFAKKPLHAVRFAVPDDLLLGETVVAIGNPFGLEHSVSVGVLSARNRSYMEGETRFNDILQTDAAINPGNSGGPLIDLHGELIGINLAIRRNAEGIGFALPVARIERVLASWLIPARHSLAFLGLIPETRVEDGRTTAVVARVLEGSPAAAAGLQPGDRVLSCNGAPVDRAITLGKMLWPLQVGNRVRLETARKGKSSRHDLEAVAMTPQQLACQRLGVRVQELTRPLRRALGLPDNVHGLAISEVLPESEFAIRKLRWGNTIRRGDIIVQINGSNTASLDDLFTALKDTHSGMKVPMIIVAVDVLGNRISLAPIQIDMTLH